MARRKKFGLILGLGAAVVVGAVVVTTVFDSDSGGVKRDVIDAGGGPLAGPSVTPSPYAIKTLAPVGTAAQDPGGGGGGDGARPGAVGPPGSLTALKQGTVAQNGLGSNLYFSGLNLLDPNRSATTSGDNKFPSPLAGVGQAVDPITGLLPGSAGGGSATGCATSAQSVAYYAIPLKVETVGFSGAPTVHLRISGPSSVSVQLMQENASDSCTVIASGSASVRNGVADVRLGFRRNFQFGPNTTPAVVITAAGSSNTISTTRQNPSYINLPNLFGV